MKTNESHQKNNLRLAELSIGAAACGLIFWYFYLHFPYSIGAIAGAAPQPLPISGFLLNFWQSEEWQHCWLVLPAIAFIIYSQRSTLSKIPCRGSLSGIVVIALAMFVYWAGYRVDNYYLGYLSIQLLVGGIILWYGGWAWMRALAFPYAFLLFLWPLHVFESTITFPLRMLMSHASVSVLNFVGVPVILQGTGILSAPNASLGLPAGKLFSVDVADPCSGIRSLFALMMVSALYAHFTLKTWWQKWVLFLLSIPLAVIGNLFRILTLTFGVMAFGPEFAIGKNALTDPSWFHVGAGYVVFAVALGGMLTIGWLLSSIENGKWRLWLADNFPSGPKGGSPNPTTPREPATRKGDLY